MKMKILLPFVIGIIVLWQPHSVAAVNFEVTTTCAEYKDAPNPTIDVITGSDPKQLIDDVTTSKESCRGIKPSNIFYLTSVIDGKTILTNAQLDAFIGNITKQFGPLLQCNIGTGEYYNAYGDSFQALAEKAISELDLLLPDKVADGKTPITITCTGHVTWGGETTTLATIQTLGLADGKAQLTDALGKLMATPPSTEEETSTPVPASAGSFPNILNTTNPNVLIGRVIKFLVGISGSLALIVFIYGGLMWVISRGDQGYVKKGKSAMLSATIGLIIIFTSYIIIRLIIAAFTSFS